MCWEELCIIEVEGGDWVGLWLYVLSFLPVCDVGANG
jgi:hypothetical protein